MVEFEKKLLLAEDEYIYLIKHFRKDQPIVRQVNYYFDTDDLFMNQHNITCRIRLKEGKYKGTIKQHLIASEHSTETEIEVRYGIHDNAFIDMDLQFQGELVTERCIIWSNSFCEVVLDKNDYLGFTDYELEIEYKQNRAREACGIFYAIIELLGYDIDNTLNLKQTVPSKSKRFFELKKRKNQTATDFTSITNRQRSSEPDMCIDDMYDDFNINNMCMFCVHWNRDTCGVSKGTCNYEHY